MKSIVTIFVIAALVICAGAVSAESVTQWMSGYYGPQDANALSLWHMDESAGDSADAVGSNLFDHWYNPTHVAGQFGNAMPFNGSIDWGRNDPWTGGLNMTNSGYTVEMWINPTSSQGGYKGLADNAGGWLFRYGGGTNNLQTIVWFGGGTAILDSADNVLTPGVWQHVALTYGGASDTTLRMYVDGVVVAQETQAWMIDPVQTEGMVVFGANKGGGLNWAGAMDEVRISNVARSFAPVPEPGSMLALAMGIVGFAGTALRRLRS